MNEQTIHIAVGMGYDVVIGTDTIEGCGARLAGLIAGRRAAIVTDSNIERLHLARVAASMRGAGFAVCSHAIAPGERSKNIETFAGILEFLSEHDIGRDDCVLALGGGVVGDLTGFAAGCYMRGVACVQLPTTLLAAVDSAVGGKTAIDLPAGKNLAGLFVQPRAVLCDTNCLATLPREAIEDGLAEAIKTAVIGDEELFSWLENGEYAANIISNRDLAAAELTRVIARCVACKGEIVGRDERDAGERALLNFGHTIGHAIESLSGYTVSHGRAVATGMAIIARAAAQLGVCDCACAAHIERALERNRLPVTTRYTAGELAESALRDKKRSGDRISIVLPERVGRCTVERFALGELRGLFERGMERLP